MKTFSDRAKYNTLLCIALENKIKQAISSVVAEFRSGGRLRRSGVFLGSR